MAPPVRLDQAVDEPGGLPPAAITKGPPRIQPDCSGLQSRAGPQHCGVSCTNGDCARVGHVSSARISDLPSMTLVSTQSARFLELEKRSCFRKIRPFGPTAR